MTVQNKATWLDRQSILQFIASVNGHHERYSTNAEKWPNCNSHSCHWMEHILGIKCSNLMNKIYFWLRTNIMTKQIFSYSFLWEIFLRVMFLNGALYWHALYSLVLILFLQYPLLMLLYCWWCCFLFFPLISLWIWATFKRNISLDKDTPSLICFCFKMNPRITFYSRFPLISRRILVLHARILRTISVKTIRLDVFLIRDLESVAFLKWRLGFKKVSFLQKYERVIIIKM